MAEQKSEPGQEAPAPAPAPTPAESLAADLCRLRLDAGKPSFRTMAKTAGSISHTTLYEAASGSRVPSWPTTRAFVRACGGDEAQWQARWTAAVGAEQPGAAPPGPAATPAPTAPPASAPVAAAGPAPGGQSGGQPGGQSATPRPRRRRIWTHAISLLVGIALGSGGTLALTGHDTPAAAPPDAHGCPAGASGPPASDPPSAKERPGEAPTGAPAEDPAGAAGTTGAAWVARTAAAQEAVSSTGTDLPVRSPVGRGDALVVTMMLTSTCPGAVSVTDTGQDRFQVLGDVTDSLRHRVLVLAAFRAAALTTADTVRADYPRASKFHIAVDEFRGVTAARSATRASGDAGGTTFATDSGSVACRPGDLLVGAVGSNTGTAPAFGSGWTALPALALSSYRLTTAHRIATDPDHCAAAGRTTSQWGAVLAVLR
ncbi:hypothetical protein ACIRS1_16795 [Kitasatospora sp. NPDC101176]|uniref:hypothetical protein n=1 Tax=Kitasatospora sp. NPDC101176 TaxID=3364099 RepID=UPI00381BED94